MKPKNNKYIYDISAPFCNVPDDLAMDCAACTGLCCTALFFSKSDGFPTDKPAGTPCPNLAADFCCKIHDQLEARGLRGCLAFDCLGAGQKVSSLLYPGVHWRTSPETAPEIFEVFLRVWQLHQLLWYLSCALWLIPANPYHSELQHLFQVNRQHTLLPPKELLLLDLPALRQPVNHVLKRVITEVRQYVLVGASTKKMPSDCIGKHFHKEDLTGADFSMALLIAANLSDCKLRGASFLGADLRDADFSGADLSESIFLTQAQLNSAKGSPITKLPPYLSMPSAWL